MTTGEIDKATGASAQPEDDQEVTFRVVVEQGADPRLQEWVDQLMADPDDDPELPLSHEFGPAVVKAEDVYALLNEFIVRRPYGPDNPPPSYAQSEWIPGVVLPDDPNEPILPAEPQHEPGLPGNGAPSSEGPKHNAKHRRLGMFHKPR